MISIKEGFSQLEEVEVEGREKVREKVDHLSHGKWCVVNLYLRTW